MKAVLKCAFAAVVGLCSLVAYAQTYPTKPIKVIVPNRPGGFADITTRLVAAELTKSLGQNVLVENKPGAGATLGTLAAVQSSPDGYTLLSVFDSHATNPSLFKKLKYDTLNDLTPISLIVKGPSMLVVNANFPAKSVAELIDIAKQKPGSVKFAVVSPGSSARLYMERFKRMAKVNVKMVPYKGGAAAVVDLAGGQVDAMFVAIPTVTPYLKGGRLRGLAITSDKRSDMVPGMPTVSETLPGFVGEQWVAFFAPARTPPEIIARLNTEIVKAVNQPEVKSRFEKQSFQTVGSSAAELDRWLRDQIENWRSTIVEAGIKLGK